MATGDSSQSEISTSAQAKEDVQGHDEHNHEHEHEHEHEHVGHARPWYAVLSEDWLATIAGLLLVLLFVFRILRAIP